MVFAGYGQQAARGGNDDFHATAQLGSLRVHIHAAKHGGGTQRQILGIGFYIHANLVGQLTRGRQHQCAHRMHGRRYAGIGKFLHPLQDGQHESGSLASAGLCGRQQIATGQYQRNGLGLDGGRLGITLFFNGTKNLGRQPEFGKQHVCAPAIRLGDVIAACDASPCS
jgi:hypothetical protein